MSFTNLTFTKAVDLASPRLLVAAASGEHIKSVVLSVYRPGTTTVAQTITLTNAVVSTVKTRDEGTATSIPLEDVGLDFTRIELKYVPTSGGAVVGGWDVSGNKKI